MSTANPPKLQPPGAGLPWWQLLAARYVLFPLAVRRLTWESATRLFTKEGEKVLALWETFPSDRLTERVLVPPLRGIEDSSRFWSAAMTVEHLNIVGFGILELIAGLRAGRMPERAPRIQDVKPRGEMPPTEVRAEFTRLQETMLGAAEQPMAPGVGLRAPHPWFGPIDAFRWHCLLGIHQRIHRVQLEAIRARLDSPAGQ